MVPERKAIVGTCQLSNYEGPVLGTYGVFQAELDQGHPRHHPLDIVRRRRPGICLVR